MIRLLHVVSDSKNNNLHVRIAQKDAEISALKAKVSELYAQNDELGRENRKYNSLKEILRKRGACTP